MTKSYEYNGKTYDFILSMRAKVEIEKAQKARQRILLGNPAIKNILKDKSMLGTVDNEDADFSSVIKNMEGDQLTELISLMDGQEDMDPVEIGFIVLSTYPPYRDEVTRVFFEGLVDDMDMKLGVEETFRFFTEVQNEVFTKLAAMQELQAAKVENQNNLRLLATKK